MSREARNPFCSSLGSSTDDDDVTGHNLLQLIAAAC